MYGAGTGTDAVDGAGTGAAAVDGPGAGTAAGPSAGAATAKAKGSAAFARRFSKAVMGSGMSSCRNGTQLLASKGRHPPMANSK